MSKVKILRTYTRRSVDAVTLLGRLIRIARKERQWTEQELAERAGVSRGLIQRIEKGDMNCSIGVVFEAANLVGIPLFSADEAQLGEKVRQAENKLTLLPKAIRQKKKPVDDDF